jgi:hypothetical protein
MRQDDDENKTTGVDWFLPLTGILIAVVVAWGVGVTHGKGQRALEAARAYDYAVQQTGEVFVDRGCRAGDDLRLSDLCAQWKAADAADSSALAAWAQVGTGLFTLLAAVAAAAFAGHANLQATRSAKVAEDMLAQEKQSIELQLRPWVTFEADLEVPVTYEKYPDGSWCLWFRNIFDVKNVGMTPAFSVAHAIYIFDTNGMGNILTPAETFFHEIISQRTDRKELSGVSIAPNESTRLSSSFGLNHDDIMSKTGDGTYLDIQAAIIITYRSLANTSKLYYSWKLYQIARFYDWPEGIIASPTHINTLAVDAPAMEMRPFPGFQDVS